MYSKKRKVLWNYNKSYYIYIFDIIHIYIYVLLDHGKHPTAQGEAPISEVDAQITWSRVLYLHMYNVYQ